MEWNLRRRRQHRNHRRRGGPGRRRRTGTAASYWAPNIFSHDALTALAVVGAPGARIELDTAVVPPPPAPPSPSSRTPWPCSLGNRFTLGIGLSHKVVIENMFGLSYDKPVRHLREYLSVPMPLSRNEPANFDGEVCRVHAAVNANGSTGFGVVVAALGEQMLRVTAAPAARSYLVYRTATLAGSHHPDHHRSRRRNTRPAPRVIAALPVCVTTDTRRRPNARSQSSPPALPSYRAMLDREGVAGPAEIAIIGSAAQVQDRIAALADIGSPTSRRWRSAGPRRDRREPRGTQGLLVWPDISSHADATAVLPHPRRSTAGPCCCRHPASSKAGRRCCCRRVPRLLDRNGDQVIGARSVQQVSAPIGTVRNCRVSPRLGPSRATAKSPSFERGRCRRWRSRGCRVCRRRGCRDTNRADLGFVETAEVGVGGGGITADQQQIPSELGAGVIVGDLETYPFLLSLRDSVRRRRLVCPARRARCCWSARIEFAGLGIGFGLRDGPSGGTGLVGGEPGEDRDLRRSCPG